MIRRNPHVFAGAEVADVEEITENWERIKRAEKARESALDGIARSPAGAVAGGEDPSRAERAGIDVPAPSRPPVEARDEAALGEALLGIVAAARPPDWTPRRRCAGPPSPTRRPCAPPSAAEACPALLINSESQKPRLPPRTKAQFHGNRDRVAGHRPHAAAARSASAGSGGLRSAFGAGDTHRTGQAVGTDAAVPARVLPRYCWW